MNRLRLWKIVTPIMGVAAVGSIAGAVGYYFYKTAPEKWNNALQEFREVRLGFDGNQMIGYLASGQYASADQKSEKLLTWEEKETSKIVYVTNETTKEVKKFVLNSANEEESIIYTLPGKQGDKFQILVESKGIKFRNKDIRANAFKYAGHEDDAAKLRSTLKTIASKDSKLTMDYDDEDIKPYTKNAAAEFKLDYMSGDVSMGGVNGKVDTPNISYIKSLDYDDAIKGVKNIKTLKAEINSPASKAVPIKYLNVYNDEKVTLNSMVSSLDPTKPAYAFGQFKEREVNYGILGALQQAAAYKSGALKSAPSAQILAVASASVDYPEQLVLIPRVMADVSPDTQLVDKKITIVTADGKKHDLGKLERYNNELTVSDLGGIYKTDTEGQHYGDLKITSWW